jgi:hypothetical protein
LSGRTARRRDWSRPDHGTTPGLAVPASCGDWCVWAQWGNSDWGAAAIWLQTNRLGADYGTCPQRPYPLWHASDCYIMLGCCSPVQEDAAPALPLRGAQLHAHLLGRRRGWQAPAVRATGSLERGRVRRDRGLRATEAKPRHAGASGTREPHRSEGGPTWIACPLPGSALGVATAPAAWPWRGDYGKRNRYPIPGTAIMQRGSPGRPSILRRRFDIWT